ncbi:MAG TPA: hypothetical protein VKB38_06695 [Terracidiphilus sp.]|nr:hypothetical protein [Terracidiphilus sp.]
MDDLAWAVVPPFDPPEVEAWVANSISQAMLLEPHRRAYLWANWLLKKASADQLSVVNLAVHDAFKGSYEISDITAGFIPVAPQSKQDSYLALMTRQERRTHYTDTSGLFWTFGLVVGVQESPPGQLLTPTPGISQLRDYDGFPVMCEQRVDADPHEKATVFHAPPHVTGATSTCFVRPAAGKRYYSRQWSEGVLIARHVLRNQAYAGAQVSLEPNGTRQVVDIDESATTIDAAILDAGIGSIAAGTRQVGVHPAIAPGIDVNVSGARTQFSAKVLRVMDDPFCGNMLAHRGVLDGHGIAGDSGALVTEQLTGQAVGLYIGMIPGTPALGLVQLMRQVTTYFEVELYQ